MIWVLLWNMDCSDHGGSKHGFFALHQLFQEVDCDVIVRRQIDTDVAGQEVIDFTLTPIVEV